MTPALRLTELVTSLLECDQWEAAALHCDELCRSGQNVPALLLWASHAYQRMGRFEAMAEAAARAAELQPQDFDIQRRLVECHIYCGRIDLARNHLAVLETRFAGQSTDLLRIAELHVHSEGHADAYRCSAKAVTLAGDDAQALYALAAAAVNLGHIDEAQTMYNRVIALNPADADAYVNRAALGTWRIGTHHLDEMLSALKRLPLGHAGEVPLCYALAKELEDLGDYERSFAYLQRGAGRRRAQMSYRVAHDVQAMATIGETFNAEALARPTPSVADECSLFVLGLPRSGTTLVERILSSHSQVGSIGETSTFAFAMMRLAGAASTKSELIQRSTLIDFSRLGALYRQGIRSYAQPGAWLIDKTPANFLYLGLIHLSLPGAHVVHLRRHPLDSCYAMYKTLFRMGYPFSYSLEDLGHYYLAYHRLMAHWREHLPGSILDVDYESLVQNQEAGTRQLLQHCELEWEPQCLEFHANPSPSATASAAQVRRPIYQSSVARWRHHEEQLAPLAEFLTRHGVDCT
jgi:tetratricopeptide (TPR) repeat protein